MRTPAQFLRGVRHPEAFHGRGRRGGYFEGWYIKLISADRSQRWAVIPGIFRSDGTTDAPDEAFVQVLDGLSGRSWYHAFPLSAFSAEESRFAVSVGNNRFDDAGVVLDLPQLRGTLTYATPLQPYPVTLAVPGIMGWYGYVPFMECFHGIVSLGHTLAGELNVEGGLTSFADGRGYIEKDWGSAFPASYVWLASNHVSREGGTAVEASLVASCAIIPGLGKTFRGSIVTFQIPGELTTWATWNGARDDALTIDDSHVHWRMTGPDGTLTLSAERTRGGLLHAPLRSAMHRRVEETLDARVKILLERDGAVVFDGFGECAGMEVFGDTDRLVTL